MSMSVPTTICSVIVAHSPPRDTLDVRPVIVRLGVCSVIVASWAYRGNSRSSRLTSQQLGRVPGVEQAVAPRRSGLDGVVGNHRDRNFAEPCTPSTGGGRSCSENQPSV